VATAGALTKHRHQEFSKAALTATKKRVHPDITEVSTRGRAAASANARRFAANVRPIIQEIMRAGTTSHNAIAQKLNQRRVKTARGGVRTQVQAGAILHPFEVATRREAKAPASAVLGPAE
jgi:hypothetical protein